MKSLAKMMIEAINPEIKEEHRLERLKCRREMFHLLEKYNYDERCAIVDNLMSLLKFDSPDYRTLEDDIIDELKNGIKSLMKDITSGRESELGDIYIRLKLMVDEDE